MIYDSYIKVGILIVLVCSIFFAGWHIRDRDFTAYKLEQQEIVKAQEAKNESIQKQHEIVTQSIQEEYDAKLNLLRSYYANGVRQPSSSSMPNISTATAITNANAAYAELAANCAQTTLMLVELQKWINEQIGVTNE